MAYSVIAGARRPGCREQEHRQLEGIDAKMPNQKDMGRVEAKAGLTIA